MRVFWNSSELYPDYDEVHPCEPTVLDTSGAMVSFGHDIPVECIRAYAAARDAFLVEREKMLAFMGVEGRELEMTEVNL